MARQKGVIKLEGEIGDISFYKTQDGYLAREKTGVTGDRIKNDPAFIRTRENGAEFSRAGKAGKILRAALRSLLVTTADGRMTSRLTREMMKVIHADATSLRGQRNVVDGEAELLRDFDFNINASLASTFYAPFSKAINRNTGSLTVMIPAFIPATMVAAPEGATHFRFIAAGAEVDFQNGVYVTSTAASPEILVGPAQQAMIQLDNAVTPGSRHPLFLAFGIEFFQFVNAQMYPLKNGAYNALSLVEIDGGV